jgi:membrane associated rhomboid family serine protease
MRDYNYSSLGASGAVSAVLFSFILLAPWQTLYVFFFPLPAIIFAVLYLTYTAYMSKKGGDQINHSAHLWGAIYGIVFTMILAPESLNRFIQQILNPSFNF